MDIKVLGAAGEVGRSAFQVNCNGTNFLLDYGVMFGKPRGAPPTYPLHVKPRDIDSVIITHAHLDHSGCVPSLFVSGNCNVYATAPTFDLSKLLIQDMIKIEKNSHSFGVPEIENMMQKSKIIGFKEKITRGNATFELISTLATSCERSTENDGMKSIPFLSMTSFAKSINPFSDSFLGI